MLKTRKRRSQKNSGVLWCREKAFYWNLTAGLAGVHILISLRRNLEYHSNELMQKGWRWLTTYLLDCPLYVWATCEIIISKGQGQIFQIHTGVIFVKLNSYKPPYPQTMMCDEQVSYLKKIQQSFGTRVPKIILRRAEEIFLSLNGTLQKIDKIKVENDVDVLSEEDTVGMRNDKVYTPSTFPIIKDERKYTKALPHSSEVRIWYAELPDCTHSRSCLGWMYYVFPFAFFSS
ncbi:uncharacterized protein LOC110829251 [Zootermopsis nevadensis]|uniref:uncharacterized protein LOC110829251 n=1 Tax=Zootermopsis nevadensis TaxID=136037 RepID=UPI000B8ECBD7|nr:uncharacterized protein LOC110829251 [Zootermopsis nevadensis]